MSERLQLTGATMFTSLETLQIAGHHPDVGAYPLLLVAALMLGVIAAFGGRR